MNQAVSPSVPSAKKILLIKLGAVGDLIMASSFFEGVRQNFPQAQISHLVSDQLFHTVKENPNIDRFIPADSNALYKGGWFSRLRDESIWRKWVLICPSPRWATTIRNLNHGNFCLEGDGTWRLKILMIC